MPKPAITMPAIEARRLAAFRAAARAMCGKTPYMNARFEEHRAEADFGQRIGEDRAVVRGRARQVEAGRGLAWRRGSRWHRDREHAMRRTSPMAKNTPRQPTQIADDAGAGRAEQIAGHDREQEPADRDLPLARPARGRRRARRRSGPRRRRRGRRGSRAPTSSVEVRARSRRRASPRVTSEQADQHQPRLAEHVGECAEHRLHQRIGQREGGRQQRRGRRLRRRGRTRSAG